MKPKVIGHLGKRVKPTICKKKDGKLKTLLLIRSFNHKRFPDLRLTKQKAKICPRGGMQQWGVKYWEIYAPVVDRISVRSLLAISSIHELTN